MANSEIDDIFAKKSKSLPSAPPKPSKKDKKRKRKASEPDSNSNKAPETIIDPSTSIPSSKRIKLSKPTVSSTTVKDKEKFKDSRGSGPRRKTEEGYSIYKADELGLRDDDKGGDFFF
ncbi:hypothetical protein GYMLUDRAFT_254408 [Collybiopsis luxurians FD-317 M1]|nr:hypothetical protein GYMLUDRAFT_254408 [Collybiopsis luxurians FD-317 M1]